MTAQTKIARTAGLAYLGIIVLGIGAELALRGPLIDTGDPAGTAAAITAHEGIWRASIGADMAMAALDVALAMLLFLLFRPVDATLSTLALVLRLVQMAVIAAHLPLLDAALDMENPLPAIARHAAGYDMGLWFFGMNGLVMAVLLARGGAPRWLSGLIGAAGIVYLTGSVTRFVAPELNALMQPAYLVCLIAELAFALWLLLGAKSLRSAP